MAKIKIKMTKSVAIEGDILEIGKTYNLEDKIANFIVDTQRAIVVQKEAQKENDKEDKKK